MIGGDGRVVSIESHICVYHNLGWFGMGHRRGHYKVNYKYAPFTMELSNFILEGCVADPIEQEHEHEKKIHCAEERKSPALLLAELFNG